jgi:hypothetical protein
MQNPLPAPQRKGQGADSGGWKEAARPRPHQASSGPPLLYRHVRLRALFVGCRTCLLSVPASLPPALPACGVIGTWVPDLPSGEDNYRFGGDVTQTIQLPINTTRTPQSQHHFSSGYQLCTARLTLPRGLIHA